MSEQKFHIEDDPLDDLVRKSLSEVQPEPSTGVWKRLSRQLLHSELRRLHFANLPASFWGIAIPAAVIITGVTIYFGVVRQGTAPPPVSEPETQQVAPIPSVRPTTPMAQPVSPVAQLVPPVVQPTSPATQPAVPEAQSVSSIVPSSEPAETVAVQESVITVDASATSREFIPLLNSLPPEPIYSGSTSLPNIRSIPNPIPQEVPGEPLPKPLSRSLDMGINITPDMVFYRNTSGSFKYNYTFDLGARYNLGRFYIQSGAGVTYSTDIGDYAISYLNNDSVGFYYSINSFTIEPGGPPQFEMKQVTVYDSVQYLYDYSTKNRYYYLQIPLTAGYRIIDKRTWRLSVEAGLLYAYLFSLNEPAPSFYIPEGRILHIERRNPERNRNSLGITGGISMEYQFARNFFLLIEPTFKYYLQAIDENSSRGDKQPYSIGLRAGIWYRLHFKNKPR
ncbi:MAG: hypothetical protein D4R67_04225 [Bacteroidetes bacterium]|nr:MAG: hypothetical protein D4R67_04225 [Bacteroidota bacterium]